MVAKRVGSSSAKSTASRFLDNANQTFFGPRGLVAAIVKLTDISYTGAPPPTAVLVYRPDLPDDSSDSAKGPIKGALSQLGDRLDKKAQNDYQRHVSIASSSSGVLSPATSGWAQSDYQGYQLAQDPRMRTSPYYPSDPDRGFQALAPPTTNYDYDPYSSDPRFAQSSFGPLPAGPPVAMDRKSQRRREKDEKRQQKDLRRDGTRRDGRRDDRDVEKSQKKLKEYVYLSVTEISR